MNNSKSGLILIILLSIILIGVISVGIYKDKNENNQINEEYTSYTVEHKEEDKDETEEGKVNVSENIDSSKVKGLIEKLKVKEEVNVLILGDGIALSQGRNSDGGIWSNGVKNLIEKNYGSKTNLKLLAQAGATTEKGLKTVQENDVSNYDLAILCYGNNDSKAAVKLEDVKKNYQSMISKIKADSPDALIIVVLENLLDLNSSYRSAINEAALTNSAIVADMKNAFISSGKKESSLTNNGLPNDYGYQIYTQIIGSKIQEAMN